MIKELKSGELTNLIDTKEKPIVIDIYTDSCPNCVTLKPIFEKTAVANKDQLDFYYLNAKENIDIAKKYKILGVPTLLFFIHGKLVDKKTGVLSQEKIEKRIAKIVTYSKEEAASKELTGYFKMPWK
ncbi:MAG TPA: thioredoxin [Crocinitomicaceae bacterium]|nr:thioredoxin [Crocinitomicaceae bacterium]